MKFKDALKKMERIAKGEYHRLSYVLMQSKANPRTVECTVYMHGHSIYSGKTWEEAIAKLQEAINPTPVKLDGMPEGDVKEMVS